jgi:hypothetical protein
MSEEFDRTLGRLSQVVDELTRVPADDFPTRDALMRELDASRDHLAVLQGDADPDAARSTDELGRELAALEMSADALRRQKIDPVQQARGSRSGEMGNLGVVGINAAISEASGLTAMERRIQRLRSILEDRNSA